jgi:acyl transferase domain-containing protein
MCVGCEHFCCVDRYALDAVDGCDQPPLPRGRMNIALIFPGQGSQEVGMGRELAETLPAAREIFDCADRALSEDAVPLSRLC